MSEIRPRKTVLRLTALEQNILRLLAGQVAPGLCGMDMVSRSDGVLKKGSIYVTLQRMADKGLVDSRREDLHAMQSDSVVVRRFYLPTLLGLSLLPPDSATGVQDVEGLDVHH